VSKGRRRASVLEETAREGESPVRIGPIESRVVWECSSKGWYTPSKAKYWRETDSEQVERSKDEKDLERGVQRA
jgi:hypothetical protein